MLWLWCRPAAAVLIRPLAQELPYAARVAIQRKNNNNLVLTVIYIHLAHSLMLSNYQLLLWNPFLSDESPERVNDFPRDAELGCIKETGFDGVLMVAQR